MDVLYTYSVQSGAGSEESYLRMIYGRNMTKSLFEEMLTNAILADEYAQSKSDSFTYSDEDLETYYEENAASLDSYEYRYCYIYADIPESTTDEDGNTVEPTEEETQAAMDAASAEADAMVAEVQSGTDLTRLPRTTSTRTPPSPTRIRSIIIRPTPWAAPSPPPTRSG